MKRVLKSERGMALALAIVALVVVGALVAGALFSGTQEQRVAENVRRVQASFGVAEEGVYDIIRAWSDSPSTYTKTYNALANYPSSNPASTFTFPRRTAASKTGSYSGTLYKFNKDLYLIDITGQDTMSIAGRIRGGGASQRLGLLARVRLLQMPTNAALTMASGSNTQVAGGSLIDGNDHVPSGSTGAWTTCDPLQGPLPGIRADTGAVLSGSGTVTGAPAVLTDPTVPDSAANVALFNQLKALATVTVTSGNFTAKPVITNGLCDKSVTTNWGSPLDPTGVCGSYFPVIYMDGGTVNGNQGQGILLVDGNLTMQGGMEFFGIVIVRGKLATAGGGGTPAHVWGSTLVMDLQTGQTQMQNSIAGGATLMYSTCAIAAALRANAQGALMRSRSFVALY